MELDRRAGDETPRVTIKRFQPLTDLAKRTRLQMTVRVTDAGAAERIARELADVRGSNGVVRFIVPLASGGEAVVVAGRDYSLDAELAARIAPVPVRSARDAALTAHAPLPHRCKPAAAAPWRACRRRRGQ